MRMSLPHLRIGEEGAGGLSASSLASGRSASSLHIGDRFSATLPNTVWVTGPEGVLPPGVLGTVAVGVLEVNRIAQGRIALEAVAGPCDDNPRAFIPDGPVAPQYVVVSRDLKAREAGAEACGRGEVIDQAVLIPKNRDACGTNKKFKATGDTVDQAIVVAKDNEGCINGALRQDVDELVMIAEDNDITIHRGRARHVSHGMPAFAFEDNALMEPSYDCAVQELCAGACEDNTSHHSV
jgi:hypothetical protein